MNSRTTVRVALGVVLGAVCGCAPVSRNSNVSNLYEVTVEFISEAGKTVHRVEITARPGAPFAVQTQDEAGNHYNFDGTLWQSAEHSFRLTEWSIGSPWGSCSASSLDLELGQTWCERSVASVIGPGESIRITKK